ncbi:amine oxidase [Solimicrobium silvestre]|uniref:Transmembrane protein n=1 Tax=Solimicrobium silvestre TaxID=2099400 RepID=A0A2S9H324_9BURK|nr:amine oxidase [Solimicrobium silvestre]PRC94384.1 hypothetical protein S2091_1005 [Solimicrobium silvestre]
MELTRKIAIGILPWAAFNLLLHFTPPRYLVLVWLLLIASQLILGWRALREGNPVAIVALALFLGLFANGYTGILPWANDYASTLCYAALAVTALATVLLRAPFTASQGRRYVPQEFWQHPNFIRINQHLSLAWAVTFALNGVLMTLSHSWPLSSQLACYVSLAAAIVFSDRYPASARQRAAQLAEQAMRNRVQFPVAG